VLGCRYTAGGTAGALRPHGQATRFVTRGCRPSWRPVQFCCQLAARRGAATRPGRWPPSDSPPGRAPRPACPSTGWSGTLPARA